MRILVTGASGFVGRHLVASLRREGKSVTTLARGTRSPPDPDRFVGPADLADLDAWPDWPDDIDSVVHLAALNPSRRQKATQEDLLHVNAAGTAALAHRARREGVRRIVFLSTANVHKPGTLPIREADPIEPQSPYAASKAEGETSFWRSLAEGTTQGCVLRPAPVYGTGGRGNVAALVRLARLPVPLPIEGLGGARSLVAIDRLTAAITLVLSAEGAAGETFLVADDGALKPGEIVRALREGWQKPARLLSIPLPLRQALQTRLGGRGVMADFVLDAAKLVKRTGWQPAETTKARLIRMAAAGEL